MLRYVGVMKQKRFKAPGHVAKPNPIALAMRRLKAFGTRTVPNRKVYNRKALKREAA